MNDHTISLQLRQPRSNAISGYSMLQGRIAARLIDFCGVASLCPNRRFSSRKAAMPEI